LYEAVAAVFLAQAYGLDLGLATQFVILAIAVVASIGVPGVPYASLVAIAVILSTIGLPTEAIGVLLVVDRFLEMARTAVDVLGDAACAAVIARLDGEALPAVTRAGPGPA
jgi:Na+/H+-dicarboxylate symporter